MQICVLIVRAVCFSYFYGFEKILKLFVAVISLSDYNPQPFLLEKAVTSFICSYPAFNMLQKG